VDYKAESVVSL